MEQMDNSLFFWKENFLNLNLIVDVGNLILAVLDFKKLGFHYDKARNS